MRALCSLLCAALLAALLGCGDGTWDAAGSGGWDAVGGDGGASLGDSGAGTGTTTSSASGSSSSDPPPPQDSSWGDGCPVDSYVLELEDGTVYVFLIPAFCDPRPYIEMGTPPPPVVAPF